MSLVVRRLRFVKLALQAQQSVAQLCRVYGFSRRSGYKWKRRFEREGLRGLRDRPRRPRRSPRRISPKWLVRMRRLRRRHRSWGARKLAVALRRQFRDRGAPAARTIGRWLRRMKLNRRPSLRRWRGPQLRRGSLTVANRSNDVWTVDFKGWFRTQDGRRVEPLTVRDLFSRYLLEVRLLPDQSWQPVRRIFLRLFRQYGYPKVIRVDNGPPFGSKGALGLSRLSAWWTVLAIRVEFIAPGHPEQNGGHEQMHRVLKADTTRPASRNPRAQQRRTDRWTRVYNQIRPHEALGQRTPAELYHRQPAPVRRAALSYPESWEVRRVRSNGQIKWRGRKRFIGEAFVGFPVGLRRIARGKYAVRFAGLIIGELLDRDAGGMRPSQYARRS
jgi:putative transposase